MVGGIRTLLLGGGAERALGLPESTRSIGSSSVIAFNVDSLCCITDLLPSTLSSKDWFCEFLLAKGEFVPVESVRISLDLSESLLDRGRLEIEPTMEPADDVTLLVK